MLFTRTILVATLASALAPSVADAQIYSRIDANGTLVLSDRKIDAPTKVYEVDGAPAIRTTKPLSAAAARFDSIIQAYASRNRLRPDLVRAVIQVESGFNPAATSPKGAMGLMQLMPQTARDLGVRNAYDPDENIRGGTKYLRQLLDKYNGNQELALAAYNAGPGAVDKYGAKVPPYRETKDYVRKVGSAAGGAKTSDVVQASNGRRVIYKYLVVSDDGYARLMLSDRPPKTGTYEIIHR